MSGIKDFKITDTTGYKVSDTPGETLSGTVAENKQVFDNLGELIIDQFNDVIDYLYDQGIDSGINNLLGEVYPVGSIYMSVSNTSPTALFGGTWEKIEGKFLLCSSSNYTLGATGGSADATLPAHQHTINLTSGSAGEHVHAATTFIGQGGLHQHTIDTIGYPGSGALSVQSIGYVNGKGSQHSPKTVQAGSHEHQAITNIVAAGTHTHGVSGDTASAGSSATGANMPPYLVVNVWKRTA